MRRLSKIAGVALAGTLVLAGCGSGSGSGSGSGGSDGGSDAEGSEDICSTAEGDGPSIAMAYDVGGVGDRSFNDSAYVGLQKAVDELGATCIEAVAGSDENDEVRAERLRTLAEGDYELVIGVGFLYSPAAATVAGEYPETNFAVIDGFATTIPEQPLDNLADLGFAEQEGSYLVGVAAALQTQTDQIGFVGGVTSPLIKKFEAGYVAGAQSITPDIEVDVAYLTEDEADSETAFANPPGGRNAATPMYEGGTDVVYHAAGSSGSGVFEAAAAAGDGMWAIGVDSDQYLTAPEEQKGHILTSMLKRIDTAVFEVAESVGEDTFKGGAVVYDLAIDGVGYSIEGGFVDDYVEQIDAAAEQIRSGEVEVPTEPAQQ